MDLRTYIDLAMAAVYANPGSDMYIKNHKRVVVAACRMILTSRDLQETDISSLTECEKGLLKDAGLFPKTEEITR